MHGGDGSSIVIRPVMRYRSFYYLIVSCERYLQLFCGRQSRCSRFSTMLVNSLSHEEGTEKHLIHIRWYGTPTESYGNYATNSTTIQRSVRLTAYQKQCFVGTMPYHKQHGARAKMFPEVSSRTLTF